MSHPAIPPNCLHFATQHGVEVFLNPRAESFESWPVNRSQKNEREIIAAVARCAWIDEAERIAVEKSAGRTCEDCAWEYGSHCSYELHLKPCIDNAEAWRLWGEQA